MGDALLERIEVGTASGRIDGKGLRLVKVFLSGNCQGRVPESSRVWPGCKKHHSRDFLSLHLDLADESTRRHPEIGFVG